MGKGTKLDTEWLISLRDAGSRDVHTAVVYRTLSDDDLTVVRTWVVALGYEGGGVYGSHWGVIAEGNVSARSFIAFPDPDEWEGEPTDEDVKHLKELHRFLLDTLIVADDENGDHLMECRLPVPRNADHLRSPDWDPDDLIEPVSDGWQLTLKFE